MKRWVILFLLISGYALAQNTPTIGVLPDNGGSLPATCVVGQIYFKTTATVGLYQCLTANTWTAVPTSSGSGTVNANSGSAGAGVFYPAAGGSTTVGPLSGLTYDTVGDATLAQGTITTSNPFYQHTVTWNAGGVAFTNWISNITCTAAATASFAAKLGVGGTDWQFKYNGANCTNPQILAPNGASGTNPSYSFVNGATSGISFSTNNSGTVLISGGGFAGMSFSGSNGATLASNGNLLWANGTNLSSTVTVDTALDRCAAGLLCVGTTNGASDSTGLILSSNKAVLTSDFTDSNASGLQVITGMAIALPAIAKNWSFHCSFSYSEATPIASDQFGIASLTTAPTNLKAQAHVTTTEGAAAVQTTGNSGNITTTTPTSIVTFTPVGAGEKPVEIDGTLEAAGSGASTLQFYVTNGTAADVIVVKRDSYCYVF